MRTPEEIHNELHECWVYYFDNPAATVDEAIRARIQILEGWMNEIRSEHSHQIEKGLGQAAEALQKTYQAIQTICHEYKKNTPDNNCCTDDGCVCDGGDGDNKLNT